MALLGGVGWPALHLCPPGTSGCACALACLRLRGKFFYESRGKKYFPFNAPPHITPHLRSHACD